MTDTDDRPTITHHRAADMIDALHDAPDGYHDGMADPSYALSSAGGVVIWWTGPTTREIADRNADHALSMVGQEEDYGMDPDDETDTFSYEATCWELIARDPALEDLELTVAEAMDPMDPDLDAGAEAARQWFRDRGLDRIADTVIVERGVWTRGPRITFRALGW